MVDNVVRKVELDEEYQARKSRVFEEIRSRVRPPPRRRTRSRAGRHHRYRISQADIHLLEDLQGGVCLICKTRHDLLVIDHDHVTEKVRGLICQTCNSGLGFFKDSPASLAAAIQYLESDTPFARLASLVEK